jgi:hypothetical protein
MRSSPARGRANARIYAYPGGGKRREVRLWRPALACVLELGALSITYAAAPPARADAALSKAAFPGMLDAEPQAVRRTSDDGEPHVLRVFVSAAIFLFLSACQVTRDREADSQKEFDSAVEAQHKTIARLCEKIESEVQRRRCLGE